ncbi:MULTISPECIES: sugar phosphate isomerase/epimerase family protein [unclassified Pantoea]|uniref:sugar phosphate isomerase/epimerase family protein n=1 Tax=unclassified Pantoea TaxID=2630326 RepID=UPI001CD3DDFE|nr:MULTISPECIES: TIM barrel protein [unclassified Pantoea]MCA1174983.1 sugar phosphate isomerase/epimerase [Pantoea sp. alder69]MCA1249945.1 sugar phosphate isomerase/epimerase [Pantoea sp. alder70]MCA1264100.1 sugar phosphate isomerase/epimerase [Pantoea sp. alder81]
MSRIGLSTYAFFWRMSSKVPHPLTLEQMLQQTAEMDVSVFQICDYPAIESWSDEQLQDLRHLADKLGITLELGTRGLGTAHLRRYLHMANILDAHVVRSMFYTADHRPSLDEAAELIAAVLPDFARQQVRLCLETYEQVNSGAMMSVINKFLSPWLCVCLDPANCVAGLELPEQVIANTAARVGNLHIKDFAFTRRDGWVGFTYAGCLMGEGLLDYDRMIASVRPAEREINQIVEHWLPWQDDAVLTCEREAEWTRRTVEFLRSKQDQELYQ